MSTRDKNLDSSEEIEQALKNSKTPAELAKAIDRAIDYHCNKQGRYNGLRAHHNVEDVSSN